MWLWPPLSSRVSTARYTPDTAVLGTVQEADCDQLPQSKFWVDASDRQVGWLAGLFTVIELLFCLRAPSPW